MKDLKEIERESQTEALTVQIFKFLKSHYGISWQQSFDQELMADSLKAWAASMKCLSPEQVDYGRERITLGKHYLDFPPNPGQFRELCLSMPKKFKVEEQDWYKYQPSKARIDETNDLNKSWFNALADEEKNKNLQKALDKFPILKYHLEHNKISVLDDLFSEHFLFNMLMDMLGRKRETIRREKSEEVARENLKKLHSMISEATVNWRKNTMR